MGNPITWDTSWDSSWDTAGDTHGYNMHNAHAASASNAIEGEELMPDSAFGLPKPGGTLPGVPRTPALDGTEDTSTLVRNISSLEEQAFVTEDSVTSETDKSLGLEQTDVSVPRAQRTTTSATNKASESPGERAELDRALATEGFERCQDGEAYERGTGIERVVIRRSYASNWRVFTTTVGSVTGKLTLVLDSEHPTVDEAIKASKQSLAAAA